VQAESGSCAPSLAIPHARQAGPAMADFTTGLLRRFRSLALLFALRLAVPRMPWHRRESSC